MLEIIIFIEIVALAIICLKLGYTLKTKELEELKNKLKEERIKNEKIRVIVRKYRNIQYNEITCIRSNSKVNSKNKRMIIKYIDAKAKLQLLKKLEEKI